MRVTIFSHHVLPHQPRHQPIRLNRRKHVDVFFVLEDIVSACDQPCAKFGHKSHGGFFTHDLQGRIRVIPESGDVDIGSGLVRHMPMLNATAGWVQGLCLDQGFGLVVSGEIRGSVLGAKVDTISVSVWRSEKNAYEDFAVPKHASQTILDLVSWIQHYADPTLTYRFSCRVGVCGSCAMMVNGEPRWTCRTHVEKVENGGAITIGPLRNLPVIKDLAVDLDPFFDKWTKAGGFHHPTADRNDPIVEIRPNAPERQEIDSGIECINCAVCYAACDTVAANPDYLGPAALQRAWTVINDTRDGEKDAILDTISGENGCFNCHSIGSCTALCPNELDPLSAIAGLKRATTKRAFKR